MVFEGAFENWGAKFVEPMFTVKVTGVRLMGKRFVDRVDDGGVCLGAIRGFSVPVRTPQVHGTARTPHSGRLAPRLFFEQFPQRVVFHGEVGIHALELGVFGFEFLDAFELGDSQAAVFALPVVVGGRGFFSVKALE